MANLGIVACIGVDGLKRDRLSSEIRCGFRQETRPSLPKKPAMSNVSKASSSVKKKRAIGLTIGRRIINLLSPEVA